jgi:hypothetical protein
MPEKFTSDDQYILDDHNYGKSGVKILHLVRNGQFYFSLLYSKSIR